MPFREFVTLNKYSVEVQGLTILVKSEHYRGREMPVEYEPDAEPITVPCEVRRALLMLEDAESTRMSCCAGDGSASGRVSSRRFIGSRRNQTRTQKGRRVLARFKPVITFNSMAVDVYRTPPQLESWSVECRVRGPLGPVSMTTLLKARDETHAVEQHIEDLIKGGFKIVGNVTARKV